MRPVWIVGAGAVGPLGLGLPEGLGQVGGADAGARLVPDGLPLKEGFPPSAMRWLDACSLWWVNAVKQALGDGETSPTTAQFVGLGWGSTPPVRALMDQVHDQGFSAMAPAHFPYSVGNAPAAQAGILLKLKGPAITLCGKEAAGLAAISEAARTVSSGLCDGAVAGGTDHVDPLTRRIVSPLRRGAGVPMGEGAYALSLVHSEAPPPGAWARVAAWSGRSAPCRPSVFPEGTSLMESVLEHLLKRAIWPPESVDYIVLPGDRPELVRASESFRASRMPRARPLLFQRALGVCGASWAGAAAQAARAVQNGEAQRALLIGVATGGAAWGLALEYAQ